MEGKKTFILRAAEIADSIQTFSHPWNSKSEISGVYLGRTVGLKRTGVNFARIAPVKSLLFIIPTIGRKNGFIFYQVGVLQKLTARNLRWVQEILWDFRLLQSLIISEI